MNYTLLPSLEHIALAKVAATLWNQNNIRSLIRHGLMDGLKERENGIFTDFNWRCIEYKVVKKVPQLSQPELLRKKILCFTKPIGHQILNWIKYHCEIDPYIVFELPSEFCWTPQGTVDRKRTAGVLIKDENLDIIIRYELACIYCLEDDILKLWNKIPEDCKKFVRSEIDLNMVCPENPVVLWTYDIKGKLAKLDNMIKMRWGECTPYQYAFECAALDGNKAATEYFLHKLTLEEKEKYLIKVTLWVAKDIPVERCDADVLCFLLSNIDEEQQMEVFESYPYKVLNRFLDLPWQSFFMETINRMWNFLSEDDYDLLLRKILERSIEVYRYGCCDNYQALLSTCWQQSPISYRKYALFKLCASSESILFKLGLIGDKNNIKLILKDANLTEKEEIIFSHVGMHICDNLIDDDNWDLLKFFIEECISSKEVMIKFKDRFKKYLIPGLSKDDRKEVKDMWNKFFQLLDDFIEKDNKMEEGGGRPNKKFCIYECF